MANPVIVYTKTDEAPALATYSFLPFVEAYLSKAGVDVQVKDISLAGRVLAAMNEWLPEAQQVEDALAYLGELAKQPEANIIKLPNISASVPQLKATIAELQDAGFPIPDYPEEPSTPEEQTIKASYDAVKGSAVNPVLREGNSDRRAPKAVKEFARSNPHSMGEWNADSQSEVATMGENDFVSNEQSITFPEADSLTIQLVQSNGETVVLKNDIAVEAGEIVDGTFMCTSSLRLFLKAQIQNAKSTGTLFSLHMKATMMKVSDPIIFGHCVKVFFEEAFASYQHVIDAVGGDPNNGLGDVLTKLKDSSHPDAAAALAAFEAGLESGPDLAMVDSDRGITNLHVPSDVIIDASMPAMIRTSGRMWNKEGVTQDTLAVIPDSSYAGVYSAVFADCKANGAYDPTSMGTVPNVGLMAKKAEEYGSHDKTFELASSGTVEVLNAAGVVVMSHAVSAGDIWRMCMVKDAPIRDWVSLAVRRARATNTPAVFWLNPKRAHDRELTKKVQTYLADENTEGLTLEILAPVEATLYSVERIRKGEDTISVTGNVLRDYLTDLFPILELGTSAKMLSIVPLMNGGGLFETGAGGSAPKLAQQFYEENHLRWDSLGEFLALAVSLAHLGDQYDNEGARILGEALDDATTQYLLQNRGPRRKCGQHDNRGSHFYLGLFWAEAMAQQTANPTIAETFRPLAEGLRKAEEKINDELLAAQGPSMDIGGYYYPNDVQGTEAMRPSATLNGILDRFIGN